MARRRGATTSAIASVARRLDTAPRPDAPGPAPRPDPAAPALEMQEVVLRSPGGDRPVLAGLSLRVAAGEVVALTGPSGGGKSTVLHLAAGLIAPDGGRVLLWGSPAAAWPEAALRARLALLPQRSALLRGTLLQALAIARPHLDRAEAAAVLEAVALSDVVARIGGLDAPLGDGGAGLSGGEARRLALARVLLRRPALLLLDEPTEGLDDSTARAVLSGIRRFLPDAAILMASHRAAERGFAMRCVKIDNSDVAFPAPA